MPHTGPKRGKTIALLALAPLCAGLVYRNLLAPVAPTAASSLPAAAARGPSGANDSGAAAAPRGTKAGPALDAAGLQALDPTLRLDLLEKSRNVEYQGGSRNIFQAYTPPPPAPVAPPVVAPPTQPAATAAPPPLNIPLRFYGISEQNARTTALLTDGDAIVLGGEGDVVAKRYKVIHIGVSSIEMEEIETHKRGQLPLLQE